SDPSTIIRDVHTGRFDATIYNTTYLHDGQETFGIELLAHPIEDEEAIRPPGSYFIYRPEDEELRNMMDDILNDMREDGTLSEISHKYLVSDDSTITEKMSDKNDEIEAEKSQVDQVETENLEHSSDGKILATKMIIQMLPTILEKLPNTILMTVVAAIIGVTL